MAASATRRVPVIGNPAQEVPIDRVHPHPKNARRGDVARIAESIRANGFFGSLIASRRTGNILVGNHRWLAAKDVGLKKVPVSYVDVDAAAELKILAADNRTSDLAGYDDPMLAGLLSAIAESDPTLLGTGFEKEDLERLLKAGAPPDAFPEVDENIETKHSCPKCGYQWS